MGCGSSVNQVHDAKSPDKINESERQKIMIEKDDNLPLCLNKCFLFGQSSGERKVVYYNSSRHGFQTITSRIRIPTVKVKLEPIEILYEETQQVIFPELLNQSPQPPFNLMFGTFFKKDLIFLCGGVSYEQDFVSQQAYFYNLSPINTKSSDKTVKQYVKFDATKPMNLARYGHMGLYQREGENGFVYIFGGANSAHESTNRCEKFNINEKKWTEIQPMKVPRSQGSTMLFMEKIYVFGGINNILKSFPENIEAYTPRLNIWETLAIKLHRGIKSCLAVTPSPNQILILGGIAGDECLSSVIRVNLMEQTYIWETDLPEPMSSIKSAQQRKSIAIFCGNSNSIYEYKLLSKNWKNLNYGYKSYIPVIDLEKFTCVTEPLQIQFTSKNQTQPQEESSNRLLTIFGNENYPCIWQVSLPNNEAERDENLKIQVKIKRVPMSLRLSSLMRSIKTQEGYLLCGGASEQLKHAKSQSFFYDSFTNKSSQIVQMIVPRFDFGVARGEDNIYIFGGRKSSSAMMNECEMYSLSTRYWRPICNMSKKRSGVLTHILKNGKMLLIGGRQISMPSACVEIYDPDNDKMMAVEQFSILADSGIKDIFIEKVHKKDLENLEARKNVNGGVGDQIIESNDKGPQMIKIQPKVTHESVKEESQLQPFSSKQSMEEEHKQQRVVAKEKESCQKTSQQKEQDNPDNNSISISNSNVDDGNDNDKESLINKNNKIQTEEENEFVCLIPAVQQLGQSEEEHEEPILQEQPLSIPQQEPSRKNHPTRPAEVYRIFLYKHHSPSTHKQISKVQVINLFIFIDAAGYSLSLQHEVQVELKQTIEYSKTLKLEDKHCFIGKDGITVVLFTGLQFEISKWQFVGSDWAEFRTVKELEMFCVPSLE